MIITLITILFAVAAFLVLTTMQRPPKETLPASLMLVVFVLQYSTELFRPLDADVESVDHWFTHEAFALLYAPILLTFVNVFVLKKRVEGKDLAAYAIFFIVFTALHYFASSMTTQVKMLTAQVVNWISFVTISIMLHRLTYLTLQQKSKREVGVLYSAMLLTLGVAALLPVAGTLAAIPIASQLASIFQIVLLGYFLIQCVLLRNKHRSENNALKQEVNDLAW